MKTVKVTIGAPSSYHLNDKHDRQEFMSQVRNELAGHLYAQGIHESRGAPDRQHPVDLQLIDVEGKLLHRRTTKSSR